MYIANPGELRRLAELLDTAVQSLDVQIPLNEEISTLVTNIGRDLFAWTHEDNKPSDMAELLFP